MYTIVRFEIKLYITLFNNDKNKIHVKLSYFNTKQILSQSFNKQFICNFALNQLNLDNISKLNVKSFNFLDLTKFFFKT